MPKESEMDIALEILLSLKAEVAPDLSDGIVQQCFFVQKNNQFTSDRSIPMSEMEKVIDAEVDRIWLEQEASK